MEEVDGSGGSPQIYMSPDTLKKDLGFWIWDFGLCPGSWVRGSALGNPYYFHILGSELRIPESVLGFGFWIMSGELGTGVGTRESSLFPHSGVRVAVSGVRIPDGTLE